MSNHICEGSINKVHCFHRSDENASGYGWSTLAYTNVSTICCHCGMNELDLHGLYHPQKKAAITLTSQSAPYMGGVTINADKTSTIT